MRGAALVVVALVFLATVATLAFAGAAAPSSPTGQASCTTDAIGYCTVAHQLGQRPASGVVQPIWATATKPWFAGIVAESFTDDSFRLRAMYSATSPVNRQPISFYYTLSAAPAPPVATTEPPPSTTTTTSPPPPGGWPTPSTAGAPAGTPFAKTVIGTYEATTPGEVIDRWHITGNLIIKADGVLVTNTQVDDSLFEESLFSGPMRSFTVRDSTVGTAPDPQKPAMCPRPNSVPNGIGFGKFTAERVKVQGHTDGWQLWGNDVVIKDSYFQPCVFSGADHADGVQDLYDKSRSDFPYLSNYLIEHNTIDFRVLKGVGGYTAPLFITGATNVTVRNNLMAGGTYTYDLYLRDGWVVTGNRSVSGASDFGDYEPGHACTGTEVWSDNDVITVDGNYVPTSTVANDVRCPT